jgi:predicted dehydrogenase
VALWGQGGPAAAQAAACAALGWKVDAVIADTPEAADPLARDLGVEALGLEDLVTACRADIVILTDRPGAGGNREAPGPAEIAAVLDSGRHLVLTPPLAATLADADAIVALAGQAAVREQAVLYGDAVCAAPAVEEMLARLPALGRAVTHISSKVVQPPPETSGAPPSPLLHHGVHGIAAALLAARLTGRGRPTAVAGERRAPGEPVTEAWMHFAAGEPIRVHASFGPASGPALDLQVATPDEVLRVDLFPSPTLERNGEALPLPATDAAAAFGFTPQLERFWADVTAGRSAMLQSVFGREVLEVVCASHASAGSAPVAMPFAGPRDLAPHELESAT